VSPLLIALLLQAASGQGALAPVEPKVDWLAKPSGDRVYQCLAPLHSGAHEGVVLLSCLTAPNDHIDRCVVTSSPHPQDKRYATAALCAAQNFRIRATDNDGRAVMDFPVVVPFRLSAPLSAHKAP
jgi:hypothetical protein